MTDEELLARLADSHLEGERQAAAAIERLIAEREELLVLIVEATSQLNAVEEKLRQMRGVLLDVWLKLRGDTP